ncbi:MAG TPA: ABC transporter permease [Solirubrobacteraceae bacterium]|jgi:ABC-type dipeptide/oligopeptide/nickel transport system permease subunit|nr:ABC transporter permease [Solirubrobacteraceae bacterium]
MSFAYPQILLDDEAHAGVLEPARGDTPGLSPDRLLWHRVRSSRVARTSAGVIVALVLIALLAPLIVAIFGVAGPNVRNPSTLNAFGLPTGPSFGHPFGVDDRGRDVFARVLYGARTPLEVGILGTALAAVIGTAVGMVAGFYGRWVETVLMVIVDALLAFPVVLLGLGIGGAIGPGLGTVILIVALTGFPYIARIVRRRVSLLREGELILAARALGAGDRRILWREILPSLRAPLIAYSVLLIPTSILLEAALSFLGAGIRAPTPDWGQMISAAGHDILSGNSAWWYLLFPGLALLLTMLAFNLAGEALVDALGELGWRRSET